MGWAAESDHVFSMSLLFLALANEGHAKKEKTRRDEHAIIYVLKAEEMSVEGYYSEKKVQMSLLARWGLSQSIHLTVPSNELPHAV